MAYADDCKEWFANLNIPISDPKCEMKCLSSEVDMSSFYCTSRCKNLCKPKNDDKKQCKVAKYWQDRLKAPTAPFKSIVGSEHEQLLDALSRLPVAFRPSSLKAVVKGTKPIDVTALLTEAASTDEFIILYPRAFNNPDNLERVIAHEIVHQLALNEWKKSFEDYKIISGWGTADNTSRSGEFVEFDGKLSADEDFANNIEYFLYDKKELMFKNPKIFSWLEKTLGAKLRLQKGCLK